MPGRQKDWGKMLAVFFAAMMLVLANAGLAVALEPIEVDPNEDVIEIAQKGEFYTDRGDSLQVETAVGRDGLTARMSVDAATSGTNPNWIVFALKNSSDKRIERWLTAPRYEMVGSGAVWPDLDARRIERVTPSVGFVPERVKSERADIFRVTLEPGQTITFVSELASERFVRVSLWKPLAYELKIRDRRLFNGIMLGLTGLLAIFLTAVFAANHKAIFPTAALVAWCVLTYLCVDFGFFHKLFNLAPEDNAVYRAATESAMAASLVVFLHTFLRLGLSHGLVRMLLGVWILAQLALVAVAAIDPRLAATFARLSFILIGAVGAALTLYLAIRGQDRALALIPTWMLFLVWIFGMGVALTGRLSSEVAVAGLIAGLVLIVVLIGFTVTQFAFRSLEPVYGSSPSEQQIRSLAVDGAGASVWEWNGRRDEVKVSPLVESSLGLNIGELCTKTSDFSTHVHPDDRERFRLMLWSVQERSGGRIHGDFRLRHSDNSYRWFELEAASVPSADRRNVRCVGLLREITEHKRSSERLMQNAVHCALTGLPHRELFIDRLRTAMLRAKTDQEIRPTIICIDIDKFKSANSSFGLVVGDSLLLTVARRLQRHLGLYDTLSRLGGDKFAILLIGGQDPQELAGLAERIRRSLRSPIKIAGRDIVLTGSLGIAVHDGEDREPEDLLKEAEIAMYRAKRSGADRIEIFRPEMRTERDERRPLEDDLRKALEKNQIKILYQPIVYLPTEELAGFKAFVRWEHPKLGMLGTQSFVPLAEESDLIVRLGSYVLTRAAQTLSKWQRELPRSESPLFVSVNVTSRPLFRHDLVQDVRHILSRVSVPKGTLRLEVTEALAMENPEQAVEILQQLRGTGVELALDEFGSGYSSLSYLQRFPFDTIKIDKELVQSGVSGDEAGSAIVRSMVALSHELGKKVVAEGVEHPDDVGFLRSIGCEYAQGFYYGEAMPEREVVQLLRIVRKSESKIEAKGLFRTKLKRKKKKKDVVATPTVQKAPAAQSASSEQAEASARVVTGLPNSTVRPVDKPQVEAASLPKGAPPAHAANAANGAGGRPTKAPPSRPVPAAAPKVHAKAPPPSQSGAGGSSKTKGVPASGNSGRAEPKTAPTAPIRGRDSVMPPQRSGGISVPSRSAPGKTLRPAQPPPIPQSPNDNPQARSVSARKEPPPAQARARARSQGGLPADLQSVLNGNRDRQGPATTGGRRSPTPAAGGNGSRPVPQKAPQAPGQSSDDIDFSTLPPGIAASLARLAGQSSIRSREPVDESGGGKPRPATAAGPGGSVKTAAQSGVPGARKAPPGPPPLASGQQRVKKT